MWSNRDAQGGDSGGGYLNSPGYGGSQAASQQQRRGQRTSNMVPCTIAQILKAETSDDGFIHNDVTLNQVTLVGLVKSARESATNLMYEIDDMTGPPFEIRQFVDNDESTPDAERTPLVRENVYVRVHGHLRAFAGKRSIVAFKVRPLTDMNELTSHFLEVIYANAYQNRSRTGAGSGAAVAMDTGSAAGNAAGPSTSGGQQANAGVGGSHHDAGLSHPQQQILNVLRTCYDETGISIATVCQRLNGIPMKVIRESVEFLSNEGHIYSTIDDEHYKSTEQ